MPEYFREEAEELFGEFRKRRESRRAALEGMDSKRKAFFDRFEELVNGAIGDCVSDLNGLAGDDATIEVTNAPNRQWYQVTITVETIGKPRVEIRRFCGNYADVPLGQTVSVQTPNAKGEFSNINGEEGLEDFHRMKRVQTHLIKALRAALSE